MINTVKIQGVGYLVNGSMSVPSSEGNRHYQGIQEWIAEGNTPEPEFTQEADKMFQEWLSENPGKELVSASTGSGEKEDSFGRRIGKSNRRQQITREYTIKKLPNVSSAQ